MKIIPEMILQRQMKGDFLKNCLFTGSQILKSGSTGLHCSTCGINSNLRASSVTKNAQENNDHYNTINSIYLGSLIILIEARECLTFEVKMNEKET